MKAKHAPLCLLLGLSVAMTVTAAECPVEAPRRIPPTVLTGGFFDAHPDLFWRSMAQRAEQDGKPARALDYYKRSALTPSFEIGVPGGIRDGGAVGD